MKVIPETLHVHRIRYLRFNFYTKLSFNDNVFFLSCLEAGVAILNVYRDKVHKVYKDDVYNAILLNIKYYIYTNRCLKKKIIHSFA